MITAELRIVTRWRGPEDAPRRHDERRILNMRRSAAAMLGGAALMITSTTTTVHANPPDPETSLQAGLAWRRGLRPDVELGHGSWC